ncbi:MAG TPA: hypothetical protein VG222_19345 [Vicinamibacterales bacterium]|nr:hypothetical protein [Vicinamibacterales bacterium]
MRRGCWSLIACLAAITVSGGSAAIGEAQQIQLNPAYASFSGRAVTDAGTFWYTEHHTVRTVNGRTEIQTKYVAADGKPIAELAAEITSERYLPKTRLLDHRDDYVYSIEPIRDRHAVLLTQQLGRGREERRTLALRDDLMTFQGVLLFIIDQRAALQRGQSLYVQSIVPSRMTSYGLRIYKRALQGNLLTVRLEMSAVAFRLFSTPSDVTIDVASGRLLEFAGPSNLLDEKDRPVRVHIIYEYP